jgi:hypothetical protein
VLCSEYFYTIATDKLKAESSMLKANEAESSRLKAGESKAQSK